MISDVTIQDLGFKYPPGETRDHAVVAKDDLRDFGSLSWEDPAQNNNETSKASRLSELWGK